MDIKIVFLLILGITTSALIFKIVHQKVYGVEGMFEDIKNTINDIIYGITVIACFVNYMIILLKWFAHTMVCILALFIPPCPFFHILDIIIAFIGFILSKLLKLLRLEMLIDAFSTGCDGINFLTNSAIGIEITDFRTWMHIKPLCYNPDNKFTEFPEFIPPKRHNVF